MINRQAPVMSPLLDNSSSICEQRTMYTTADMMCYNDDEDSVMMNFTKESDLGLEPLSSGRLPANVTISKQQLQRSKYEKNKRVSFQELPTTTVGEAATYRSADLTLVSKHILWYQKHEMRNIVNEIKVMTKPLILQRMSAWDILQLEESYVEDSNSSLRGLEALFPGMPLYDTVKYKRNEQIQAVLSAQRRGDDVGEVYSGTVHARFGSIY